MCISSYHIIIWSICNNIRYNKWHYEFINIVFINHGQITEIQRAEHAEDGFYFGEDSVSYSRLLGPEEGIKVYHGWGLVLSILESRWGFMFFIIFPTIFAVVYEVYSIIEEIKSGDEE